MTPTQKISAILVAKMKANGGDLPKAFDATFGPGAYKAFASSIYHELRAKAAREERARQVADAAIARAKISAKKA